MWLLKPEQDSCPEVDDRLSWTKGLDGSGLSPFHIANIDHYYISAVMILTFLTSTQYLEKYQYSTTVLAQH